jgi:outer membrane protein
MKKYLILPAIGFSCICSWSSVNYAAEASALGSATSVGSTLEDFFTAALSYSPKLRIAAEQLNIGSARKRAANGALLPQINANANLSDNRRNEFGQLQEFDGERFSVSLSQTLFNWEAFAARSEAYLREDQMEATYYAELALLLTDVAERYFTVLQSSDALESISSELDAIDNQVNQIQSFYDLQLAQITDLYDAQARQAAVQSQQLELQSQLALSREALRAITGVSIGQLYELAELAEVPTVVNNVEYWVQQALTGNKQILASQFALQAAAKSIDGRRGAYMPRVSLIVQRQDSNLGFDNALINQTDTTFIGLDVSIPLYAGGRNNAAVSEAISRQSIAESELRQIQLDVGASTRTAFLQVKSSELRTAAATRLVESTTLSATANQQGFDLGTVTSVDVLNSLRDRYIAERDLQRTRYEHINFYLMLMRETGMLTPEDLLEIGALLVAPGN